MAVIAPQNCIGCELTNPVLMPGNIKKEIARIARDIPESISSGLVSCGNRFLINEFTRYLFVTLILKIIIVKELNTNHK